MSQIGSNCTLHLAQGVVEPCTGERCAFWEPGGAVALAALLSRKAAPLEDSVVVLSGGNIDPALHAEITRQAA